MEAKRNWPRFEQVENLGLATRGMALALSKFAQRAMKNRGVYNWCKVVQNDVMSTKLSPTSENVRLTISVSPEVHQTFQRLAKASGMSISRAMGEWLSDTLEAAEFMATKVEQARAAPGIVMREMHAYAQGLADETGNLIEQVRAKAKESKTRTPGQAKPARAAGASIPSSSPRPVIRGVKSTDKGPKGVKK